MACRWWTLSTAVNIGVVGGCKSGRWAVSTAAKLELVGGRYSTQCGLVGRLMRGQDSPVVALEGSSSSPAGH